MVNGPQANGGGDAGASDRREYHVNFFKPTSAHAKANMALISTMVIIWAVAVFGFQVLLMVTVKPTPEPAKAVFDEVWPAVTDGSASVEARQKFASVTLSILGKNIAVKPEHKAVLNEAVTCTVADLLGGVKAQAFLAAVASDEKAVFDGAVATAKAAIGLADEGFDSLRADVLPFGLVKCDGKLSDDAKSKLPGIAELYLVHNQSALTDLNFLGFPFHYWYTAQFLLILFVLLCLIYARKIDAIHKRHGFVEE